MPLSKVKATTYRVLLVPSITGVPVIPIVGEISQVPQSLIPKTA